VVRVGGLGDLMTDRIPVGPWTWADHAVAPGTEVEVQVSAHGQALPARLEDGVVVLDAPARRVAPGQTVAAYRGEVVIGSTLVRAAA
jgi:tRNA-uridine 2-sulfurtransferase